MAGAARRRTSSRRFDRTRQRRDRATKRADRSCRVRGTARQRCHGGTATGGAGNRPIASLDETDGAASCASTLSPRSGARASFVGQQTSTFATVATYASIGASSGALFAAPRDRCATIGAARRTDRATADTPPIPRAHGGVCSSSLRAAPSLASCPPRYHSARAVRVDVRRYRQARLGASEAAARNAHTAPAAARAARSPVAAAGAASAELIRRIDRRALRCRHRLQTRIASRGSRRPAVAATRSIRRCRRRIDRCHVGQKRVPALCLRQTREQRRHVEHQFVEFIHRAIESAGVERRWVLARVQPAHPAAQRFTREEAAETRQHRFVGAPQVTGDRMTYARRADRPRPSRSNRRANVPAWPRLLPTRC